MPDNPQHRGFDLALGPLVSPIRRYLIKKTGFLARNIVLFFFSWTLNFYSKYNKYFIDRLMKKLRRRVIALRIRQHDQVLIGLPQLKEWFR